MAAVHDDRLANVMPTQVAMMAHRAMLVHPGLRVQHFRTDMGVADGDRLRRGMRRAGSHVEVITPDAESRAAMGVNQLDLATRIPSARAGHEQASEKPPA